MASFLGRGGNYITTRPNEIFVYNKASTSKNLPEAYQKHMKFYRDACRRMPFIIQVNYLHHIVHPTQAKLNLGSHLRKNMYVRNMGVLDYLTTFGYEWLYDSVWMHNHYHNFKAYILSPNTDNLAYSYLDEKKYAGCSGFLKGFYTGADKANY